MAFILIAACAAAWPADAPIAPMTVCEALRDIPAQEGKAVTVLGRYSFRQTGRSLSEQACAPPAPFPPELRLVEDYNNGPKPPDTFAIDGLALRRKLLDMQKHTQLAKFPFGTPDYDRWAVVYGRLETPKATDGKPAPPDLVFRGGGVVAFVTPEQ